MSFSFLDRVFRSNPLNQPGAINNLETVNSFLEMFGGGGRSESGEPVNALTALEVSTVWACVSLITSQIGINSQNVYEVDGMGNQTEAVNHDYFNLVTNSPNPEQDSISFRSSVQLDVELFGNGYIEIQRDNGNRVVALWQRPAHSVKECRMGSNNTLCYETNDGMETGQARIIKLEDMIHIKGMSMGGIRGLDPLHFFKGAIGSKLAMDKYGARFFANNATPSGILTTKLKVLPEVKKQMADDWHSMVGGHNQHRVPVVDQDLSFQPLSTPQNDAQYLETKTEVSKEIAAFFGVQGYAVGLLDKGIKANVEQQAQDLYNYCLRPRMAKWDKQFSVKLFSNKGRSAGRYITKFNVFDLLHPDSASIIASNQSSIQNGVMVPNEGRARLGLNSLGPVGDVPYIQLNMQTLENANLATAVNIPPDTELALETEMNSLPKQLGATYRNLFKDGVQRVAKLDNKDYKAIYRCLWPTLDALSTSARMSAKTEERRESDKVIDNFILGMEHRAKKWNTNVEETVADEFRKFVKAAIFAANADAAVAKSKKEIVELDEENNLE